MTPTKSAKVYVGERQDGSAVFATVSIPLNEQVCAPCMGNGRVWFEAGFAPWQKAGWEDCEYCNGNGTVKTEDE
jgi:DnaJ-class molecular chaperone